METSSKIIVKPVPRPSVQNRHAQPVYVFDPIKKQRVDIGQQSGKTKAARAVDIYQFDQDILRGVYITGLEEMIANPYKNMEWLEVKMQRSLSDKWDSILPVLVTQDKISKQVYYEILDSVEPNFYTSRVSQSMMTGGVAYDPKLPKTFIEKFNITLYDGANVFTGDTSRGRFAIQLLKNKKNVAKNRESMNVNYHTFYIAEENEEELDRIRNDRSENMAIAALTNIMTKYPPFKLYQLAITIKNDTVGYIITTSGDVSSQIIEDQLNRFIKGKGNDKARRLEIFMEATKLFNEEPDRFLMEYMYAQGINTRVFTIKEGHIFWNSKLDVSSQYKWKNEQTLKNFLLEEYKRYNPKAPDDNAYADLKAELLQKGVKFE